jgi:hypothetical protein
MMIVKHLSYLPGGLNKHKKTTQEYWPAVVIHMKKEMLKSRTIPLTSEEHNTMENRQVSWLVRQPTLRTFPSE